jgi:hypothetical protein
MNKIVPVIGLLLLLLGCQSVRSVESTSPRFAIFLILEPSADLNGVELEASPVLTDADIVWYNWRDHTMLLTNRGFSKLPKHVGVRGKPFVVVADGERCYLGAFWTSMSSLSYFGPMINVAPIVPQGKRVTIEWGYPSAGFGKGKDPRSDPRILKVLAELRKVRKAPRRTLEFGRK